MAVQITNFNRSAPDNWVGGDAIAPAIGLKPNQKTFHYLMKKLERSMLKEKPFEIAGESIEVRFDMNYRKHDVPAISPEDAEKLKAIVEKNTPADNWIGKQHNVAKAIGVQPTNKQFMDAYKDITQQLLAGMQPQLDGKLIEAMVDTLQTLPETYFSPQGLDDFQKHVDDEREKAKQEKTARGNTGNYAKQTTSYINNIRKSDGNTR